jgi:hypothetical protein
MASSYINKKIDTDTRIVTDEPTKEAEDFREEDLESIAENYLKLL